MPRLDLFERAFLEELAKTAESFDDYNAVVTPDDPQETTQPLITPLAPLKAPNRSDRLSALLHPPAAPAAPAALAQAPQDAPSYAQAPSGASMASTEPLAPPSARSRASSALSGRPQENSGQANIHLDPRQRGHYGGDTVSRKTQPLMSDDALKQNYGNMYEPYRQRIQQSFKINDEAGLNGAMNRMWSESGKKQNAAMGDVGGESGGLFQINAHAHKDYQHDPKNWQANIDYAGKLYQRRGNWGDWAASGQVVVGPDGKGIGNGGHPRAPASSRAGATAAQAVAAKSAITPAARPTGA